MKSSVWQRGSLTSLQGIGVERNTYELKALLATPTLPTIDLSHKVKVSSHKMEYGSRPQPVYTRNWADMASPLPSCLH